MDGRFAYRAAGAHTLFGDKAQAYPEASSRIVYIGTSKKGIRRMSASAAARADLILSLHGVTRMHVVPVTYRTDLGHEVHKKLERALIMSFRDAYGTPPLFNRDWPADATT